MPTLTLKGLPEELHDRLKEQAERHRRSMNSEAIMILERTLMPTRQSAEAAIAKAEALNRRIGKAFPDIVNEAKREGRA
ncbi:FitA-like ribbon-helix-helix domain-containing protein [Salisaeta longa]|uniref:FitA-like ribbon-helix-helix domain-containing protein n=1 Tax=Salisaeta longa TaxID=503170 RepID=UPI0003B69DBB|nr:Arc family DNA-binding protein [Salisaeta longa]